MATDREIKGIPIKTYAGDAPTYEKGDVWWNSSTNKLRVVGDSPAASGTWASAPAAPVSWNNGQQVGTSNSQVITYGGYNTPGGYPPSSNTSMVFSYDSGTWAQEPSFNSGRDSGAGTGSSWTAALYYGGSANPTPTTPQSALTEEYNGTSWTEVSDLNNGRTIMASAGNSTESAYSVAGMSNTTPPGGPHSNEVDYFNGTSWTALTGINQPRRSPGGFGVTDSVIVCGGDTDSPTFPLGRYTPQVESWNGSSWTETTDYPFGNQSLQGTGTSNTDGAFYAGYNGTTAANSLEYNYWNGATWTAGGSLNAGKGRMSGNGGTATAAIAANGNNQPGNIEVYDIDPAGTPLDISFS